MKKLVLVFSGPSGAGKSTLISHLLNSAPSVKCTVSCTTRKPRPDETNGVDYFFITNDEFDELIKRGEFIEYVECYGNKYGTLKSAVAETLKVADTCILDLEFNGAHDILSGKLGNFDCVGVLILPPSLSALKNRLINRKTETKESLEKRLAESFNIPKIAAYKHVLINDNLERAKTELGRILRSYREISDNH